jgi:hypothetical protein
LRSVNWQICKAVNYALWLCPEVQIELRWYEDRQKNPEPRIFIQGSEIADFKKALECIDFLLSHARCIKNLILNIEVSNSTILDKLLTKFLEAENVQLEVLKIRRRYVGQSFPIIADLIYQHSKTLKIVGKIGLSEAVDSFNDKLHLERLSLMNFDLVENGELDSDVLNEQSKQHIRRLAGLGATFEHLSYTTYSGFDIAKSPNTVMLKNCGVKSLRLTMQKGIPISVMTKPILNNLHKLEFIGDLEVDREDLSVAFPNLQYFDFHQQNLCC